MPRRARFEIQDGQVGAARGRGCQVSELGFWAIQGAPTKYGGIFRHVTAPRLLASRLRQAWVEPRILDGGKSDYLADEF